MEQALGELVKQAPYIAALVIICGGFLMYIAKLTTATAERQERQEERHAQERREEHDKWKGQFESMGAECHKSQDRATDAIETMAKTINDLVIEIRTGRGNGG